MNLSNERDYDVVIAGAGPSGSAAAIRLSNAGFRVLLVEEKKFPRDKLCGEFISPECLSHFEELGVMPQLNAVGGADLKETVFYSRSGRAAVIDNRWFGDGTQQALGLSRSALDATLLDHCCSVGVDVRQETSVTNVLNEDECVVGVAIKNNNGEVAHVSARLTIDATGRKRSLEKRIGNEKVIPQRAGLVAFKTHIRNAEVATGVCELFVYRGGYGGSSEVENGLHDLCFIVTSKLTREHGSDAERIMREIVMKNPRAAKVLERAVIETPWVAVPIERFGRGRLVPAEGLITIGDAAAFIDPFTGSGILLALESAKVAASAIRHSFENGFDLEELEMQYRKTYAAAFNRRLLFCSLLRRTAFVPYLADSMIELLRLSKPLRRQFARATRQNSQARTK
ncbi:MAG: NAD(P)/FAD-dependent oxidoreductase [Pyrinomonadaceae bacterium]